ncbi:MAG: hypothetical protein ABEH38_00875 [Flavobacteriales bacterium]
MKVLALIPGPFFLVTGLLSVYLGVLDPRGGISGMDDIWGFMLLFPLSLIGGILLGGTVIAYMRQLEEGEVRLAAVKDRVFKKLGSLFLCCITWVGILLLFAISGGGSIGLLAASLANVAPFLVPIIFLLAFLMLFPPAVYLFHATLFRMLRDDVGLDKGLQAAWGTLRINYWRTWGVVMVGSLLFTVLTLSCAVPEGVFEGVYGLMSLDIVDDGISGYILKGLRFLRYMATQFLWGYFIVLLGLHYYSLFEIKSGEGILHRFDELAAEG